jgi:hypothetical protein
MKPDHTASAVSRPSWVAMGTMTRLRKREVHYHHQSKNKPAIPIHPSIRRCCLPVTWPIHVQKRTRSEILQDFGNQTANQLIWFFSLDLWRRLVPQTCESYPPIRHATIAIGALDPKTWRSPARSFEETARRQFAYHEYSMAIAEMRSTMTRKSLELRVRLIACLVVFCSKPTTSIKTPPIRKSGR